MTVHTIDALTAAQAKLKANSVKPVQPAIPFADVDAIFAPLPPVPWLVQRLDMCPGAPTLIAGYGFSGKTVGAQAMAISVASGRPVWSDFLVARSGRVVHVDYEQGFRLTAERYQRLARGMDISMEHLRGRLALASMPQMKLSDPKALDAFMNAADGAALMIVDSLRASAPDIDENSSEVRRLLDLLTTVSEKTSCIPLVIHHSRKPRDEAEGGAKASIRGSSAVFDACASVLVFAATKGQPTLVIHEKARTSGITLEDFGLVVDDVEVGGDPRGGLQVRTIARASREDRKADADREKTNALDAAVLDFVRRHPGCSQRAVDGTDELVGRVEARRHALTRLQLSGSLEERPGARGARTWWASSTASHCVPLRPGRGEPDCVPRPAPYRADAVAVAVEDADQSEESGTRSNVKKTDGLGFDEERSP